MELSNLQNCSKIYWDNKRKSIAASAFCLLVSFVALGLLLTLGRSLTHHQFQVCLYTTITLGAASLIVLIIGCILKKAHFTKEIQKFEYPNGDKGFMTQYRVNGKLYALKMNDGEMMFIREKNTYYLSVEEDSSESGIPTEQFLEEN